MAVSKIMLIPSGILVTALLLKLMVSLSSLPVSEVAVMRSYLLTWLKTPYICVIINLIIIIIVASSKLDRNQPAQMISSSSSSNTSIELHVVREIGYEENGETEKIVELQPVVVVYEHDSESANKVLDVKNFENEEDKFVISSETVSKSEIVFPDEEHLVSNPQGGQDLNEFELHDSLENTWKTITEGRTMSMSKQIKNCDTWENHNPPLNDDCDLQEVLTLEMLEDRTNHHVPSSTMTMMSSSPRLLPVKLRKEPSLSQDELNKRAEEFIKKFNEDMRLQRLESLNNQQKQVTSHGVY